jgi:opacity protein-like surface antigen
MSSSVRILLATIGLVAAANAAYGADLSPPPLSPASVSWTGLYIGLNAGYAGTKLTALRIASELVNDRARTRALIGF